MLAAGVTRKRRRYLYQIKGWWFVLFSFYCSPGVVARLSKCEITLCIGNTHVLKLFCFDRIFNLKLTDLDLYAYGSIRRGSLRMNYAWTPFQAKVKGKLIQIFLALPLCDLVAWQR